MRGWTPTVVALVVTVLVAACDRQPVGGAAAAGQVLEARALVHSAVAIARRMKANPKLRLLMEESRAILIVPSDATGTPSADSGGRLGVLLAHRHHRWSSPAFYDIGMLKVDARGGEAGSVAMMLMSDRAADCFSRANTFSLNAGAGFTLVDAAERGQASVGGPADVIVWSDAKGTFDDAKIDVNHIGFEADETSAYYGGNVVSARDVLTGKIANPREDPLDLVISG